MIQTALAPLPSDDCQGEEERYSIRPLALCTTLSPLAASRRAAATLNAATLDIKILRMLGFQPLWMLRCQCRDVVVFRALVECLPCGFRGLPSLLIPFH